MEDTEVDIAPWFLYEDWDDMETLEYHPDNGNFTGPWAYELGGEG